MGKIKQGILGGFNGTTGSVVGASWKGIAYMRGKAQSIKNPRTDRQQSNRRYFGVVSDLMSKALTIVNDGYRAVSSKKSPFNTAVQDNMKVMIDPRAGVDLDKAQFSNGSLLAPIAGAVTETETAISAVVNCVGNSFEGTTVEGVAVYIDAEGGVIMAQPSIVPVSSGSQSATITFTKPANLTFEDVKIFSFVYDDETHKASPTIFVGSSE